MKKKRILNNPNRNTASQKRRRIIAVVIITVLMMGTGFFVWSRTRTVQQEIETVKIEKAVGQEIVFAQISEINGNEITYIIAEAAEREEIPSDNESGEPIKGAEAGQESIGEMPEGFRGGNMPDRGEMPGDFGGGSENFREQSRGMTAASDTGRFIYDGTTYRVGTETITTYIPVGTNVTTKLGTVTTFSRLASEDCVALVIEKVGGEDVIVAVYIVG